MHTSSILQYMKKHGQKLDREIAKDTGISLTQVRLAITELQDIKQVSSCNVINFEDGVAIEGAYVDSLAISHHRHLAEKLRHKHR